MDEAQDREITALMVETGSSSKAGVAADALENLIGQFSSKYDCFRELVQNSIDAGSQLVEVWTEFEPDDRGAGVTQIHVDDDGEGMDKAVINGQLTKLFSSRKEGDLTKIGKFGIGFVSIFALEPEAVLIHTGRGGQYWEVLFARDKSFQLKPLDAPVEGTQITLFLQQSEAAYQKTAQSIFASLDHWCSHSETEITFEERFQENELRQINQSFEVPGDLLVRHEIPGTEIVAAFHASPRFGFYNRGLALYLGDDGPAVLDGRAPRFENIGFKIKSRYLEHTLSRETVVKDKNYDKAMRLLDQVVKEQLIPRLQEEIVSLGQKDRLPEEEALFQRLCGYLLTEPDATIKSLLDQKFLQMLHRPPVSPNEALEALGDTDTVFIHHAETPVTAQAAEWFWVFDGRESKRGHKGPHSRLVLRLLHAAHTQKHSGVWQRLWGKSGPPPSRLRDPHRNFYLLEETPPGELLDQLEDAARGYLKSLQIGDVDLCWVKLAKSSSQKDAPDMMSFEAERCGTPLDPKKPLQHDKIALVVDSPFFQDLVRVAERSLPTAGYLLAQRMLLSNYHNEPSALGLIEWVDHEAVIGGAVADIQSIIARAQRHGSFGRRRHFTLESSRAFAKMRKFAHTVPHLYILELIQGAVANGAEALDVQLEDKRMQLSYTGGRGFTQERLEVIFDRIFASQDRGDDADLRALAMAFNTVHGLSVERIVLESGDGTLEGSARLEVVGDEVDVGEPEAPILGTYIVIHAPGLKPELEHDIIVDHCISSHVPISVNGEVLFFTNRTRLPVPFGYQRCITFDEGDLYGTIGLNTLPRDPAYKILVNGVHLWSFENAVDSEAAKLTGGLVYFSRLRKTVDHADAVRDEVWDELWARLQPYADWVLGRKKTVVPRHIQVLGDPMPTALRHARARLDGAACLILVNTKANERERGRAEVIADLLGGLAVVVEPDLVSMITSMVASDVFVIAPSLRDASVMSFFNRELAGEPQGVHARKGLVRLTIKDFPPTMGWKDPYAEQLPGTIIDGDIYLDQDPNRSGAGIYVRFVSFGRVLWEGLLAHPHRGLYLDIRLPSMTPEQLSRLYGAEQLGFRLLKGWAFQIQEYQEASVTTLLDTQVAPQTPAAHTIMAEMVDAFTLGVDPDLSPTRFRFQERDHSSGQLKGAKVFRSLSGVSYDLGDLERLMTRNYGLLYGALTEPGDRDRLVEGTDISGLDPDAVLKLDEATEDVLVNLIGAPSYVRVDRRDVLARSEKLVLRDLAIGLRDYPEDSLLAEMEGGAVVEASELRLHQEALLENLMEPLTQFFSDHTTTPTPEPVLELLRQSVRHLQWAAVFRNEIGLSEAWSTTLINMKLFVSSSGVLLSFRDVQALVARHGRLHFFDGTAEDVISLWERTRVNKKMLPGIAGDEWGLLMNPYLFKLFESCFEVDNPTFFGRFRDYKGDDSRSAIVSTWIQKDGYRGRLGIAPRNVPPVIAVSQTGKETRLLDGDIAGLPVFGRLHESPDADDRKLKKLIRQKREDLGRRLLEVATSRKADDESVEPAIAALLNLSSRGVEFHVSRGRLKMKVGGKFNHEVLQQLQLQVRGHGIMRRSPMALLHELRQSPLSPAILKSEHSQEVRDWLISTQDKVWDLMVREGLMGASARNTLHDRRARIYGTTEEEKNEPEDAFDGLAELVGDVLAGAASSIGGESWGARTKSAVVAEWKGHKKKVQQKKASQKPAVPEVRGDEPEILIQEDGTVSPHSLVHSIQCWLRELSTAEHDVKRTTVHLRSRKTFTRYIPHLASAIEHRDPPGDRVLLLGTQRYPSGKAKTWVVRAHSDGGTEAKARLAVIFNWHAPVVRAALRDLEACTALYPQLLLAAYSAANYRFEVIERSHEMTFQREIMRRMIEGEAFFQVRTQNSNKR